jgi:hypothetical protein
VRLSRRRAVLAPASNRARRLAAIWRTPVRWRPFVAARKRKVVASPVAGSPSNAWNVNFNNGNTNNNDITNTNNVRCVR